MESGPLRAPPPQVSIAGAATSAPADRIAPMRPLTMLTATSEPRVPTRTEAARAPLATAARLPADASLPAAAAANAGPRTIVRATSGLESSTQAKDVPPGPVRAVSMSAVRSSDPPSRHAPETSTRPAASSFASAAAAPATAAAAPPARMRSLLAPTAASAARAAASQASAPPARTSRSRPLPSSALAAPMAAPARSQPQEPDSLTAATTASTTSESADADPEIARQLTALRAALEQERERSRRLAAQLEATQQRSEALAVEWEEKYAQLETAQQLSVRHVEEIGARGMRELREQLDAVTRERDSLMREKKVMQKLLEQRGVDAVGHEALSVSAMEALALAAEHEAFQRRMAELQSKFAANKALIRQLAVDVERTTQATVAESERLRASSAAMKENMPAAGATASADIESW